LVIKYREKTWEREERERRCEGGRSRDKGEKKRIFQFERGYLPVIRLGLGRIEEREKEGGGSIQPRVDRGKKKVQIMAHNPVTVSPPSVRTSEGLEISRSSRGAIRRGKRSAGCRLNGGGRRGKRNVGIGQAVLKPLGTV